MQRKILIFGLLFFSLTMGLFTSPIFANDPYLYKEIYMTAGNGTIAEKSTPYTYTLDQQPWLYLQLKDLPYTNTISTSNTLSYWTWDNPSGADELYTREHTDTLNGMWLSFDGSEYSWNDIKELGDWSITANTDLIVKKGLSTGIDKYAGSTSFKVSNVVPEPASVLLYLLGGGSLVAGFFRKKKA